MFTSPRTSAPGPAAPSLPSPADPLAGPEGNGAAPVAPDGGLDVPRDSSPTWELEMLVSGAVLFSLFQLPPQLDRVFAHWEAKATYEAGFALMFCFAYLKGALYTLIAAFVVHLGVRAYWVGLVGLNSVFPGGIRWERMTLGPISREVYRERLPTLPKIIARLDNFASIIFSFAFMVVLMALVSIPLAALGFGIAYGFAHYAFGGRHLSAVFYTLVAICFIPMLIVGYDVRYGAKLDPDGPGARRLRRLIGAAFVPQLAGLVGPTLYTISTNGRRGMTYALFYLILVGSMIAVIGQLVAGRGVITLSGSDYFSTTSDANSVSYGFYESTWNDDVVNDAAPSIQSDVITTPYVRLFIPYQPERHNPAIAAACPGVHPLTPRGLSVQRATQSTPAADSASAAVLRCLTTMHAVRMNGAEVPGLRFRFATHPMTGVDGIVAYLPTQSLPRGENVITVMPPPRRPGSLRRGPLEPWVIPFWL